MYCKRCAKADDSCQFLVSALLMFCSGKVKMYARVHFSMDCSFLWTLVQFQLTMNCNILYWIMEMVFLLPISGFFCFAIVFCYMVTLFSSVWLEARLSNQKLKNRDRTVPSSVSSDVRDSLGLTISRGHVVWASLCRPAVRLGYFSKTSW